VVDALALRSQLYQLNESFTNPDIVKVFHGAESDIIWLQCDFGVYVVNLFDTYHASHCLNYSQHSLAYLLKYLVNFNADKKYQLADWRIRPLPKEMLKYARDDTHYLLYIYDRMKNDLLANGNQDHNLMNSTLNRSKNTSLNVYHKDIYDEKEGRGRYGWASIIHRDPNALNGEQFAVLKAIHKWRDQTAREEDESPRYVMPNHILRRMAEVMPTDPQGVHGCCNPIPPLVRMYSMDIARLIEKTKTEFLKNKKEHDKQLQKINEMKQRQPIHKFYDEEGEMNDADAEADGYVHPEELKNGMDVDEGEGEEEEKEEEEKGENKKKKIPITIAEKSTLLIESDEEGGDKSKSVEDRKAYELMLSIRQSLKLVSPSVTLLKMTASHDEASKPSTTTTAAKASSTSIPTVKKGVVDKMNVDDDDDDDIGNGDEMKKDDGKEIFTISETVKNSHKRKATESIEEIQKLPQGEGGAGQSSTGKKKHKKNKRSKKRSSTAANASDATSGKSEGEGEGEGEKEGEKKEFVPYDYEHNKSEVIEMIKADANAKTVMETHKDKLKKLKNNKKKEMGKTFKPFNALPNEVKFSEKIQKNAVTPRSGNRSYTFKNNKK